VGRLVARRRSIIGRRSDEDRRGVLIRQMIGFGYWHFVKLVPSHRDVTGTSQGRRRDVAGTSQGHRRDIAGTSQGRRRDVAGTTRGQEPAQRSSAIPKRPSTRMDGRPVSSAEDAP